MYTNITYSLHNWKTSCIMNFIKYQIRNSRKIRKQKTVYQLEIYLYMQLSNFWYSVRWKWHHTLEDQCLEQKKQK